MTLHAPFDGLGAPCRDPDRWMGLLQWARPDRAIFEMEELSVMTPDRLGPCGHDEIIGFFETPAGFLRIDSVPYVLWWNAAHEAGDEPSVRKAVDHSVFFGDAHGMIAQRQDVAKDPDLDPFCLLAQRRGDQVRRRHGSVRAIMMLVKNHAVETKLFAVGHFLQVLLVVCDAFSRIKIVTRHRSARCFFRNMRIG